MIRIYYFFKHRALPFCLAYVGRFTLFALLFTCRIQIQGRENIPKNKRWILTLWHNRIPIAAEIVKKSTDGTFAAVVSNSRHGMIVRTLIESYRRGYSIAVPHNKKSEALKKIMQAVKDGPHTIVFTPDGPRGPRYSLKPGLLIVAKKASAEIVPLSWSASRFWQLSTWDKMIFPKPFSTIYAKFGVPINPDAPAEEVQSRLLALDEEVMSTITPRQLAWPK